MSSERKEGGSSSPHPELASRQVRDLLAGRSEDLTILASSDPGIREAVAGELLDTIREADSPKQQRARQLFIDHGYLDDTVRDLREAASATLRASAATALGQIGSRLGTTPLIAALFDSEAEVREAATAALTQIGDPSVVIGPATDQSRTESSQEAQELSASPDSVSVSEVFAPSPSTVPQIEREAEATDDAEYDRLLQDESSIAAAIEDLQDQLRDLATARAEAINESRLRADRESEFQAEVDALRLREEELKRKVESEQQLKIEAERESQRLANETVRLQSEYETLKKAALERAQERARIGALRLAEAENARLKAQELYNAELTRLRSEGEALARATEEAALRRVDLERARRATEEHSQRMFEERARIAADDAVRNAETERLRREAEEQNNTEQKQLTQQIETLRRTAETLAARRSEIANARRQAEAEAQRLSEEHARMQAAEENRRKTEAERLQLEAQLLQRVEEERRLVAEASARFEAEQRRVEEEAERRAAEAEKRLAELEQLREQQELEARQQVETEQRILDEVQRLADAEADARKRIEQADLRRRAAEDSQQQAEEKAVKIEAEAHLRAVEEEQALAKLEAVKSRVAAEAQARSDQEKRIRDEIDQLRKTEEEARRRIEEETLRRVQAETQLQQERARFQEEEAARLKAEVQHLRLVEQPKAEADDDWRDEPSENLRPIEPAASDSVSELNGRAVLASASGQTGNIEEIKSDLSSDDASKRAAALTELARLEAVDAFATIAGGFDDSSPEVQNAAALAMMQIDPKRSVEWFTRAFEEASDERRRNIGLAIAHSGLALEAVNSLNGSTREVTYNALCLLFLMAKTGEVGPLVKAIEEHKDLEVRRAAIRLLTLSGQSDIADAAVKRRLIGFPSSS